MDEVERAVRALRGGGLIVIPTDTVYGLACAATSAEPAQRLYALKGRKEIQPTALVAASVAALLAALPELDEQARAVAQALLPGPYTLVVANPAHRFAWLCGGRPEAIGVRVPALRGNAQDVVERFGVIVATSANLAGGHDPRRLADVPSEIRAGAAAVIDGGELPGVPSTVVDVMGEESYVIREGAVPAATVRSLVADALRGRAAPR